MNSWADFLFHFLLRRIVILLAPCCGVTAFAQEVMPPGHVVVISKDSTLISVDAKGIESKSEAPVSSASLSRWATSQVRPGGRIEVSGGSSAVMILSESVTARLEPGTQIEVPEIVYGEKPTTSLKLLKGKMFVKVDAAKLKKDGDVEFRLQTPKSLLAVRGTKFVVDSGEMTDSVVLLEGGVAVRDQATGKFAVLRPKQAADIAGGEDIKVRPLTQFESKYGEVFDQAQLEFVSYEIEEDSLSSDMTKVLTPNTDGEKPENWISKPEIFSGKLVKFDGFSTKGLRAEYNPDKPYLPHSVQIELRFSPKRLKVDPDKIIGVLIKMKSTAPHRSANLQLNAFVDKGQITSNYYMIPEIEPPLDQAMWTTHFAWNFSYQEDSPKQRKGENRDPVNQLLIRDDLMPAGTTIQPFIVEIASIQIVTQGGTSK